MSNSATKYTLLAATFIAGITWSANASAQVESATTVADPSRVAQDILDTNALPAVSDQVEVKDYVLQDAPEGSENITLELNTLEIDGVSAYTAEELRGIYGDKLNTTVTLADVYAISNALTRKYRNDGFILTQVVVPPQTIENGTVKLRVVEGVIDKITVEGDLHENERSLISKYANNLQGNVLDAKKLERNLLLINDLPGVTARSILSPSRTTTGASDLTIIVERDRYEASVGIDNHGSRFLGPYQMALTGTINSRLGLNERISAQLVMSGDKDRSDELLFGSISYDQPINRHGTSLRLVGSYTSTEPGDSLDEFDVLGRSQFASASISHPIIRSRTMNWLTRATFDLRDVNSKNDLEPDARKDRIRAARIGTTFQFMDSLFGAGINAIDIEVAQGLSVFGASRKGQDNLTRANGYPRFTKAELQLQRLQRVSSKVNLLAAGTGQWSATPLLSSEEFGVGGTAFGRGYDSSEIVGEDGIAGKLELQWNEPRNIKHIDSYQLYSFFDIGSVWNQDATTSDAKRQSLSSTGVGFRADITDKTKAGFSVALPLTQRRDTSNDRDPRYYFNVSHSF